MHKTRKVLDVCSYNTDLRYSISLTQRNGQYWFSLGRCLDRVLGNVAYGSDFTWKQKICDVKKKFSQSIWKGYSSVRQTAKVQISLCIHAVSPELSLFAHTVYEPRHEKMFLPYGNNKAADQPAHQCSLISNSVIRFLDSIISILITSKISRL